MAQTQAKKQVKASEALKRDAEKQKKVEKKPFKQLAICGTAETLKDAPFDDDTYDIWACATCIGHPPFKRADAIFEIHPRERWQQRTDQLNKFGATVYMPEVYPEIPKSKRYPIEDVLKMFPRRYFTNTVSYMLALAMLLDEYSVIGIYGVHFATNMEYAYERPNLEYYIGRAEGMGIQIEVPDTADIMHCSWLYGYEHSNSLIIAKNKRNEFKAKMGKIESQMNEMNAGYHQHKGAVEAMEYMMRILRS